MDIWASVHFETVGSCRRLHRVLRDFGVIKEIKV